MIKFTQFFLSWGKKKNKKKSKRQLDRTEMKEIFSPCVYLENVGREKCIGHKLKYQKCRKKDEKHIGGGK